MFPRQLGSTRTLRTTRMLVSVDPNVRPFFVRDRDAFRRRLGVFLGAAHLIKLSEEDMRWLHPGVSRVKCCQRYLEGGASLVVITRGEKGACAMNSRGMVEVPAEPVRVRDTVGAGDSFQAGLLSWLWRENGLEATQLGRLGRAELTDLLAFGARAAAVTCSRAGCDPPWLHEVLAQAGAPGLSARGEAVAGRCVASR